VKIRVVVTGRSYHTAESLPAELELERGDRVDDALRMLGQLLPADQSFPASALVAVSGKHLGTVGSHENRSLQEGDELVLIAPVSGG
jgi:molybdopterin converting factor small subunit